METCARSVQQKWELNGRQGRRQMTTRIIASLNYMPEEPKKAKRSTTSVDLLVVEAIRINQRSEVDQSTIAKIAHSQAAIA